MALRMLSGMHRFNGLCWAYDIPVPVIQINKIHNTYLYIDHKGWDSKIEKYPVFLIFYLKDRFLNRRLFVTTETELNAMAAPANIGFNRNPVKG